MKRVLALAGAALLVGLAVVVRGALDDDGDADVVTGGGETNLTDLVVACVPELEAACQSLDVDDLRLEDPAATIDAPDVDAWVTLDPWPEIAAESIDGELTDAGVPIATVRLTLVLHQSALETCPDQTWTCAVDSFGDRVATLPAESALGLLSIGSAAADWFKTTLGIDSFAANDFGEPGFRTWVTSISSSSDPLEEMLQFRGADRVAVGTSGADAIAQLSTAADRDSYTESPGAVPATVVAVVTGPAAEQLREPLAAALADLGWEPAEPGARSTGVPSAGVLYALAQEVS